MIKSYYEMPVAVYDTLLAIVEGDGSEAEKDLRIVAVLSGKSEDELLDLPITEFMTLKSQASFVLEMPQPEKVAAAYKVGEWELVPCGDVRQITAGQYIDFKTFALSGQADEVMLLSCLMVPKGCKYNEGYDIVEVQRALRENLPITSAVALKSFFLRSWMDLMHDSLAFSVSEMEKAAKKERNAERRAQMTQTAARCRTLLENGDGSHGLTQLLRLPILIGIASCRGMLSDSSIPAATTLTRKTKSRGRSANGGAHTNNN